MNLENEHLQMESKMMQLELPSKPQDSMDGRLTSPIRSSNKE